MRHYEIVILIHINHSEQAATMLSKYQAHIEAQGGKIHRLEDWGRRPLAYPINDAHKAHYALINIECTPEALAELEHSFRFNDGVIRHLVVKRKAAITEPSPMVEAAADEEADA